MAIPKGARPQPLPPSGRRASSKSSPDYNLASDYESQLYILANLHRFQETGFMMPISEAKELFNYPVEKDVKDQTFMTNANTHLTRKGPPWLRLGRRFGKDGAQTQIVFKHNNEVVPELPSISGFIDLSDGNIDEDQVTELLEEWDLSFEGGADKIEIREVVKKPRKKRSSGDNDEDDEDKDPIPDDDDDNEDEEEEEEALPKKKPSKKRSGKKKSS